MLEKGKIQGFTNVNLRKKLKNQQRWWYVEKHTLPNKEKCWKWAKTKVSATLVRSQIQRNTNVGDM